MKDDFWFRNGKILNPEPVFYVEKAHADVTVDCHDALICPGFIDIQLNGKLIEQLLYIPVSISIYIPGYSFTKRNGERERE